MSAVGPKGHVLQATTRARARPPSARLPFRRRGACLSLSHEMPRPRTGLALALALLPACFSDPGAAPVTDGPAPATTEPTDTDTDGGPAVCGDGELQAGEACDDGPLNGSHAACKDDCSPAVCGDGLVAPLEPCDDGDDDDLDGCTISCEPARCGDGLLQDDEACDDGNALETDACASTCLPSGCGDGVLQLGEECDHGSLNADDAACTSACTLAVCGDKLLGPGEACEKELDAACGEDCKLATCGNDVGDPGEDCESAAPDCTPRCLLNVCGDGFRLADEDCDDGNLINGDGCSSSCEKTTCGDLSVQPGEVCDDGNTIAGDGCYKCQRDAKLVFVTAATVSGALGGIESGDALCEKEAADAGLTGSFRAWLSDGLDPPAARFVKSTLPYVLPGEAHEVVAADWLALVTGELQSPIFRTATGEPAATEASCESPDAMAWTHARATGSPAAGDGCSGFLADVGVALAGQVRGTSLAWSEGCPDVDCELALRLYCFEQ